MKNSVNALPAIVLSDISKQFGTGESQVSALKGVNLEIAKGDFIALCGPSGSGKSTLLNILSGIDQPSAGQVIFLNHLLNALPEKEMAAIRGQHLGFIFQFFNLIPVLNVLDNIFYPLVLNGYCNKKEAKTRALHALDSAASRSLRGENRANYPVVSSNVWRLPARLRISLALLSPMNRRAIWI